MKRKNSIKWQHEKLFKGIELLKEFCEGVEKIQHACNKLEKECENCTLNKNDDCKICPLLPMKERIK